MPDAEAPPACSVVKASDTEASQSAGCLVGAVGAAAATATSAAASRARHANRDSCLGIISKQRGRLAPPMLQGRWDGCGRTETI